MGLILLDSTIRPMFNVENPLDSHHLSTLQVQYNFINAHVLKSMVLIIAGKFPLGSIGVSHGLSVGSWVTGSVCLHYAGMLFGAILHSI
jgi:hypothetical protein